MAKKLIFKAVHSTNLKEGKYLGYITRATLYYSEKGPRVLINLALDSGEDVEQVATFNVASELGYNLFGKFLASLGIEELLEDNIQALIGKDVTIYARQNDMGYTNISIIGRVQNQNQELPD